MQEGDAASHELVDHYMLGKGYKYHVLNVHEGGEETEVVGNEHRVIQLTLFLC